MLAATLLLCACGSAPVVRFNTASADTACLSTPAQRDIAIGVALSGGGSRAALSGAAGLEALGRLPAPQGGSVLEQVGYLSSVSGGGLASAFYGMHKPGHDTPALGPDGAMTPPYEAFFADFKLKLSQDFEGALIRRQLGSFRSPFNSAQAARSLTEILDEGLVGPGTFAELSAREQRGDSPVLIFNTTLYNNGRRLLFTTLEPDAMDYDFFADLDHSLAKRGITRTHSDVARRRWEQLLPVTPLDLQIDPCPEPLARAVAASASFPPLLGPITFQVGPLDYHWHVGDGGLYENLGLESLMFTFLNQLQDQKVRRALIISFNSGFPFSVGFRILGRRTDPWTLFSYDFSRIPAVMEERANAYWSVFYRSMQDEGVIPDDTVLHIVFLSHNQAHWEDDLDDLPLACRHESPPLESPEDVQERIAQIPTRFVIESACDRQLLATAAAKVVAQNKRQILDFLATPAVARPGASAGQR
jgi:hypothetical protein